MMSALFRKLGLCVPLACAGSLYGLVELTPQESAWVQTHSVIRVAFGTINAPFSMPDAFDSLAGIDAAVLQRVAAETGLSFTFERAGAWDQAAGHLQAGEVDAVVGVDGIVAGPNILVSNSFMGFPLVLIGREDAPFLALPNSTNKQLIALPKSVVASEWLTKNPTARAQIHENASSALTAVSKGRASAALLDLATVSYVIRTEKRHDLKIIGVFDQWTEQRIAIRGDWPELISIVNKALNSLSPADNQILSRLWISQENKTYTRGNWWVWVLAAGGFTAAIVSGWFVIHYRRRMSRLLVERKRLQAELAASHQRATSLLGEKTEVLRIALQHFDRPVSEVLSLAEKLASAPLSDHEVQEAAVEISAQNARMRQSLDVLREMQAIADNSRRMNIVSVNIGAVVKEALVSFDSAASKKRVRLSAPSPAKTWLVRADLDTLRKVIESLVGAAIKASATGSTVSVALWQAEDRVLITVSDEGPGLAVSDESELYGRPGQSSPPLEGGEKSATYGLGLIRNLVMAMDGWLWCESEIGRGATFVIELPIAKTGGAEDNSKGDAATGSRRRRLQHS